MLEAAQRGESGKTTRDGIGPDDEMGWEERGKGSGTGADKLGSDSVRIDSEIWTIIGSEG